MKTGFENNPQGNSSSDGKDRQLIKYWFAKRTQTYMKEFAQRKVHCENFCTLKVKVN